MSLRCFPSLPETLLSPLSHKTPQGCLRPDATAEEKGFVKHHPLATCQRLVFLLLAFENPSFIKDKTMGPRKHRTHLVDEGADKVNEADLQLGEFVRLVSVHHGLAWGRKS